MLGFCDAEGGGGELVIRQRIRRLIGRSAAGLIIGTAAYTAHALGSSPVVSAGIFHFPEW